MIYENIQETLSNAKGRIPTAEFLGTLKEKI